MSTPNAPSAAKYPASQQGRTPSQIPGATPSQLAGATPPVSTPFSNSAHAAFSPRGGPRTSPQQFKKSPAVSLLGQLPHNLAFDSPSTAAALGLSGAANMSTHEAMEGFQDMRPITRDDDKLKRLEAILEILSVRPAPSLQKQAVLIRAEEERLRERGRLGAASPAIRIRMPLRRRYGTGRPKGTDAHHRRIEHFNRDHHGQ